MILKMFINAVFIIRLFLKGIDLFAGGFTGITVSLPGTCQRGKNTKVAAMPTVKIA